MRSYPIMKRLPLSIAAVALLSCGPPPKPISVGLALAYTGGLNSSFGPTLTNFDLAASHILAGGGLRGGRPLVRVDTDSKFTPAGAQEALEALLASNDIKVGWVLQTQEATGRDMSGKLIGAGVFAAERKIPVFCVSCTSTSYNLAGLQAQLGAEVEGVDETCLTAPAPATCDLSKGTIKKRGFMYRTVGGTRNSGYWVGKLMEKDGVKKSVSFGPSLSFFTEADQQLQTTFTSGTVLPAVKHAPGAAGATEADAQAFKKSVADAFATAAASLNPVDANSAMFFIGLPVQYSLFLPAHAALSPKPQAYFGTTGFTVELLNTLGAEMEGCKGIATAVARGPSPGTWVKDFAAAQGLSERDAGYSIYADSAYDTFMMTGIAIYATKKEDPTPEEIKAALDTIHDPNGVKVGYNEFAVARKAIDEGKTVNYEGVSSSLDWDDSNGTPTPYAQFRVVKDGSGYAFETSALPE